MGNAWQKYAKWKRTAINTTGLLESQWTLTITNPGLLYTGFEQPSKMCNIYEKDVL